MASFNLADISALTQRFIAGNRRLAYETETIEADQHHVLLRSTNLFSLFYCQITNDRALIAEWPDLQVRLFDAKLRQPNRYLVYLLPEALISEGGLHRELSRAERDDAYFRKVFIGLPQHATKEQMERSLADRIPLWFQERNDFIRQFVPVVREILPDSRLIDSILLKTPAATIKAIEHDPRFEYLFSGALPPQADTAGMHETRAVSEPGAGARLTGLRVSNFRRFETRWFDLSGDVVIVYGRNGTGKTTLCDAIEYSMFSSLRRLYGDPDLAINEASDDRLIRAGAPGGAAKIELLGTAEGRPFRIESELAGGNRVQRIDESVASSLDIIRFLTRNAGVEKEGYLDILLHTHFLGQHSIRDFIYGGRRAENARVTETRYNLLAEMFGFGEVEVLKEKLTLILSQLRRRVTEANESAEEARKRIRGLKVKFGPKCRGELENKGYELADHSALRRLRELVEQVGPLLTPPLRGEEVPSTLEDAAGYCEQLKSLLSDRIRRLEARTVSIRQAARILGRLTEMHECYSVAKRGALGSAIVELRRQHEAAWRVAADRRKQATALKESVDSATREAEIARDFLARHDAYMARLAALRAEEARGKDNEVERTSLIRRQAECRSKLSAAEQREHARLTALKSAQAEKSQLQFLATRVGTLGELRRAVAITSERVAAIKTEIAAATARLKGLDATPNRSDWILDVFADSDGAHRCPCCNTHHPDTAALRAAVAHCLEGPNSSDLREFFLRLRSRAVAASRVELTTLIKGKANDCDRLEAEGKAHAQSVREILDYAARAGVDDPSTDKIQSRLARVDATIEQLGRDPVIDELASVRAELDVLAAAFAATKNRGHAENLAKIRREMEEIVGPAARLFAPEILENSQRLELEVARRCEARDAQRAVWAELDAALRKDSPAGSDAAETLLAELEALLRDTELRALEMAELNPDDGPNPSLRTRLYDAQPRADDLSRLIGLLSAQQQENTLRDFIVSYEQKAARWENCRAVFEGFSNRLTSLAREGIDQSLGEYGPLINQIYQKFSRHDIFARLVLESKTSKKLKRRDLFLRLMAYDGKTEYTPASYLSEAQLNILALSIFLTRVMYQNISRLETVLIDDPIQQMDDMNAAAFVDVLIGLSQIGKQTVITTCNRDFYELVCHKLRVVARAQKLKLVTINLEDPDQTVASA